VSRRFGLTVLKYRCRNLSIILGRLIHLGIKWFHWTFTLSNLPVAIEALLNHVGKVYNTFDPAQEAVHPNGR